MCTDIIENLKSSQILLFPQTSRKSCICVGHIKSMVQSRYEVGYYCMTKISDRNI